MKRKQLDSRCCILVKFRNLHGMEKKLQIRNSTVEFLTFVLDGNEDGVKVLYKDDTIWATQKAMSILFDCSTDNVGLHLKNIFNTN